MQKDLNLLVDRLALSLVGIGGCLVEQLSHFLVGVEALARVGRLHPLLGSTFFVSSAKTEEVVVEVIRVAVVAAPAQHIQPDQQAVAPQTQVGGPVAGQLQLGDDASPGQVGSHSLADFLGAGVVEARHRHIVQLERDLVARCVYDVAFRVHHVLGDSHFAQPIREARVG